MKKFILLACGVIFATATSSAQLTVNRTGQTVFGKPAVISPVQPPVIQPPFTQSSAEKAVAGGDVSWKVEYVKTDSLAAAVFLGKKDMSSVQGSISLSAEDYVPLVREDRVWEYVEKRHFGGFCNMFRMKFDGISTHYGKEYHNFRFVGDRVDFVYDYEDDSYTGVKTSKNPDTVYYIREESGRVYLLCSPEYLVEYEYNGAGIEGTPLAEGDEALLYDFNAKAGESYDGIWQYGSTYGFAEYHVGETEYIDIAGEECLVQQMDWLDDRNPALEAEMVEGVGITNGGYLPYLDTMYLTTGGSFCCLNKVFDSEGEVIYTGLGLNNPILTSVEEIGADVPADTRIYDLFGREVVRLQRGSIYIRGGRKLVWQ